MTTDSPDQDLSPSAAGSQNLSSEDAIYMGRNDKEAAEIAP